MGAYDDDVAMPPAPDFPNNPNNPNDPDSPCDAIGICPDGTRYDGCAIYINDPCWGHYKPIIDPPAPNCTGYCEDGTAYDSCVQSFVDPCRGHYVDPKPDPTCGNYTDEFISKQSELWKCINCDKNTFAECTAKGVDQGLPEDRDTATSYVGTNTATSYVGQSKSRQFTITLSDDEVADLCNCPTEPTQR